jgi:hypothetical protein
VVAVSFAGVVTGNAFARWILGEVRARRPDAGGAPLAAAGSGAFALVALFVIVPEEPPLVGRFTSAQGLEEALALLGCVFTLWVALSAAPLVDWLERRLSGDDRVAAAPGRISPGRVALSIVLSAAAIAAWLRPEPGVFATGRYFAVAFSLDGSRLAASTRGGLDVFSFDGRRLASLHGGRWGEPFAFSPDGRKIATGAEPVQLWDVDSGKIDAIFDFAADRLAFTADGAQVVASIGTSVVAWNPRTGARVEGREAETLALAARAQGSSDGRHAASLDGRRVASLVGGVVEVRHHDGALEVMFPVPCALSSFAFSPGGDQLVLAQLDHTLRVVRADCGALVGTLEGPRITPRAVAWSSRGAIVSAGEDGLRLWEARLVDQPK